MSDCGSLSLRICKTLCSNGGSMEEGQLAGALGVTPGQLSEVMDREQGGTLVVREHGAERWVVCVSPLRMCSDRNQTCGGDCGHLHLCRFFILGGCNRPHCKFAHAIDSEKTLRLLRERHLEGVTVTELRFLLLQNDPALLPDVCVHYNRGEGAHGSCTYKSGCNKLHVCLHSLQGSCKFGGKCKRSHDLGEEESRRKLLKWGLAASLVPQILTSYLNAHAIKCAACGTTPKAEPKSPSAKESPSAQPSPGAQPIEEICLYFLLNTCSFRERCVRDHYHLPYRWQLAAGGTWKDVPGMEDIERAYCDPNDRNLATHFNFDTMMFDSTKVRRLSTPSSASKPPHFRLTTQWLWYWKDEHGLWIEYGRENGAHSSATITSNDLENVFLSDESASVQFKAGKQSYVLCFKDMKQRNVKFGTERRVCRRPRFVSAEDVTRIKTGKLEPSKLQDTSTPLHWDKGQLPDVGYKLVQVSASSEEYKKIEAMFCRTLPSTVIQSIQRIQNQALWVVYQWQKEQMKKLTGREVDERQLFHGTSSSLVDAICQQNFDWRICGAHGTAYGKGSYFARDSSYSHKYSKSADSGQYTMFVARVLVGDVIQGSSSYLRPPAKSNSPSSFYDSCVDNQLNPSIFVIFEKHQIYPEYLIRYADKPTSRRGPLW